MSRSKSSQRWLKEYFADEYVKKAHAQGLRSRAAFKLKEIQEKYNILHGGMQVVDLGAAPGGWSQVAAEKIGPKGKIIAMDILPMAPIAKVDFLQGDFTDERVFEQFCEMVQGKVDLVLSDMAPNLSGVDVVDQARSMYLAELAFDFALSALAKRGRFLVKVFQGADFDAYLRNMRQHFKKVVIHKPKSSRARSRELYLLASELKL